MFDPTISVDCYTVSVDAERYDTVEMAFVDGTTVTFEDEYRGQTLFGFRGDGRIDPGSETAIEEFHGPIQQVTVRAWDLAETVTHDGTCVFEELTFDCDSARHGQAADVRMRFVDGSFKQWDPPADADQTRFGSPGRVIETISEESVDVSVPNPNQDCEPGPYATVFEGSEVTVGDAEFAAEPTFERIELRFVDGTSQAFGGRGSGPNFTAPETVAGTGDHAGTVIESVVIEKWGGDIVFRLVNPR